MLEGYLPKWTNSTKQIIRPAMVYRIECWTSKIQLLPSSKENMISPDR